MPIQEVNAGQPVEPEVKARPWNDFIRAANAHQLPQKPGSTIVQTDDIESPTTSVKVELSSDVEFRQSVGLINPSLLPTNPLWRNRMLFGADAGQQGRFALTQREGSTGQYLECDAGGIVQCTVNIPTDGEWINRADIDSGDATRLLATPNGSAQILWKETGTGDRPAIVRLGNPEFVALPGKANGVIEAGTSSGSVIIWQNGVPTNYPIDTVHLDWMAGGLDISNDKEVLIGWFPDEQLWRVIGAECEDNPPAVGQLADDGTPTTQILTTTPAPWNAFDASQELGTSNVSLDSTNATITLPANPSGDHVYRFNYSGSISPDSNNNTYIVDFTIDGTPSVPTSIDARQANQSVGFSAGGLFVLPTSASSHAIQARIYMLSGSDSPDWQSAVFSLERNLDF